MFNVTILKMKDILKFAVGLTIIIFSLIAISKFLSSKETNKSQTKILDISLGSLIGCLDETLPTISSIYVENDEKKENTKNKNYIEKILKTEISSIEGIEINQNIENNFYEEDDNQINSNIVLATNQNLDTQIVTNNPIAENYNVQYGKVKIKNQTSYTLTDDILKPDIKIENKNILIFHTHSCESYKPSEGYEYTQTGNYRTTDLSYSVTRVGSELENYLKQYKFNVIHDKSYHDYPSYNGSYTRSLETVENILKTTTSDIIIDLHRDAIGSREDYAPTVKIGDDYCAQIMFVIRYK